MATTAELRECERSVRAMLEEHDVPPPDEIEHGDAPTHPIHPATGGLPSPRPPPDTSPSRTRGTIDDLRQPWARQPRRGALLRGVRSAAGPLLPRLRHRPRARGALQ